jgi:UDP-glucose 4-epimerase
MLYADGPFPSEQRHYALGLRGRAARPKSTASGMTARPISSVVLGGGGFLGVNLCRRLAASGGRVRAFGRRCPFPQALLGVDWYQGDFSDTAALAAAIESYDTVFHLVHATTPNLANLDMAADLQQSVVCSIALLDISRKLGVKRIVFVSSGGVIYGPAKEIPTPEDAPTEPISAYGISKLAIEKYLALYRHLYGFDFRVLRVANPFGPFQVATKNQGIVAALIGHALAAEPAEIWGDGSAVRDYIFVDDVVDALLAAAIDRSDTRIFNIGSGSGRSVREIVAAIEAQLGRKIEIRWKPGRRIDVAASVLAIERAKAVMGWAPKTSFDRGLEQTIAWWRERTSARAALAGTGNGAAGAVQQQRVLSLAARAKS